MIEPIFEEKTTFWRIHRRLEDGTFRPSAILHEDKITAHLSATRLFQEGEYEVRRIETYRAEFID